MSDPIDSGEELNVRQELSDEEIQKCLEDAERLKQDGSEAFRAGEWMEALGSYRSALGHLPLRKEIPIRKPWEDNSPATSSETEGTSESTKGKGKGKERAIDTDEISLELEAEPLTGLQLECAKARAILNANIGACYVKMEDWKAGAESCTEALKDDPNYIKARQRRAICNEKVGSWLALSTAEEDYTKLLELLPLGSPQVAQTKRLLQVLKPRLDAVREKETAEMWKNLKGVGNSILGKFGLSTDNFKFEPNGQGGYSMNFGQ